MAEEIPFHVRRSARARRPRVRVDAEHGVEVVLPSRAPHRLAELAVAELRPWIEQQLERLALARAQVGRVDGQLPYLDERLTLVVERGRRAVRRVGATLLVPDGPAGHEAVEGWYRRAARVEVTRRLDAATASVGLRYGKLAIRNQRTRWASCASTGNMSFNWRLLLAPEHVLDYVVWHEVCHLEIADHSAAFWALLATRCPDWRESAGWLAHHGRALAL